MPEPRELIEEARKWVAAEESWENGLVTLLADALEAALAREQQKDVLLDRWEGTAGKWLAELDDVSERLTQLNRPADEQAAVERCKATRFHPLISHDHYIRCEREAEHDGKHASGATHWTDYTRSFPPSPQDSGEAG